MATIKQINANRKNALLSKGPKTDLGKLNSSKNSLKHGLTAKQLVIGEDLKEFEQYRDLMIEALKPEGILEEQVVFKIIDVGFRLRRIGGIEAGIYNQEILHHEAEELTERRLKEEKARKEKEIQDKELSRKRYNRETFLREQRYIRFVNPFEPINKNKLGSSKAWKKEKKFEYY